MVSTVKLTIAYRVNLENLEKNVYFERKIQRATVHFFHLFKALHCLGFVEVGITKTHLRVLYINDEHNLRQARKKKKELE